VKVVIVDYSAGNLRSVERAVARAGFEPLISGHPEDACAADVLIVPGQGAAADTMRNLRERRLVEPIREHIAAGRPFLGVCMGLQALLTVSEEGGEHDCLGVIPGRVRRLPKGLAPSWSERPTTASPSPARSPSTAWLPLYSTRRRAASWACASTRTS
jgi:glutamine amidotransferase